MFPPSDGLVFFKHFTKVDNDENPAYGNQENAVNSLPAIPLTFDEKLWHITNGHISIHTDERAVFHFKDEKEIVTKL